MELTSTLDPAVLYCDFIISAGAQGGERRRCDAADAEAAAAIEAEDEGRIVDLPSLASLIR